VLILFYRHVIICTPFTMIAIWQFANAADFRWARERRAWAAVWVLVISMVVLGMNTGLIGLEIHPVCYQDILRYSSAVSEAQLCFSGQTTVTGHGPPIPSISTGGVGIGRGYCTLAESGLALVTRWGVGHDGGAFLAQSIACLNNQLFFFLHSPVFHC
jgi:hypothetical protein